MTEEKILAQKIRFGWSRLNFIAIASSQVGLEFTLIVVLQKCFGFNDRKHRGN